MKLIPILALLSATTALAQTDAADQSRIVTIPAKALVSFSELRTGCMELSTSTPAAPHLALRRRVIIELKNGEKFYHDEIFYSSNCETITRQADNSQTLLEALRTMLEEATGDRGLSYPGDYRFADAMEESIKTTLKLAVDAEGKISQYQTEQLSP